MLGFPAKAVVLVVLVVVLPIAVVVYVGMRHGPSHSAPEDPTPIRGDGTGGAVSQDPWAEADRARLAKLTPEQRADEIAKRAGLKWNYRQHQDDMGRGAVKMAVVQSSNQMELQFPYAGPQRATLQLRTHPRYGKDVIVSVERGQFVCHSDDCRVPVRFGDGAPVSFRATQPADGSTTSLFLHPYDRFVSNAKKVGRVRIEAPFFEQGIRVLEFDVGGLVWQ